MADALQRRTRRRLKAVIELGTRAKEIQDASKARTEQLETQLQGANNTIAKLNQSLKSLRESLGSQLELHEKLTASEHGANVLLQEKLSLEQKLIASNEELSARSYQLDLLRTQVETLEGTVASLEGALGVTKGTLSGEASERSQLMTRVAELERRAIEVEDLADDRDVKKLQKRLMAANDARTKLHQRCHKIAKALRENERNDAYTLAATSSEDDPK